jgi:acetyltransferase-like isoleucine patch superfamily enzyme
MKEVYRIYDGIFSRGRNLYYRFFGVNIRVYANLKKISIPRQWEDIHIGRDATLDDGVVLLCSGPPKKGKISIGERCYINRHTMIDAHEEIAIGPDCMIGPFCYLTDGDHARKSDARLADQGMVTAPVVLEDNVWVGAHATILKGVRVGRHAVIGAGAVVTKDVAAFSTVVGVPARKIGERGAAEEMRKLDKAES